MTRKTLSKDEQWMIDKNLATERGWYTSTAMENGCVHSSTPDNRAVIFEDIAGGYRVLTIDGPYVYRELFNDILEARKCFDEECRRLKLPPIGTPTELARADTVARRHFEPLCKKTKRAA